LQEKGSLSFRVAVAADFCLLRKDAGCEQERRSKTIRHEEHEGHEKWNVMSRQIAQLIALLRRSHNGVRVIGVAV